MKKLLCFITVMMLTVITASAQEFNTYIIADEQTGSISVSGTGAEYGGQLVSILIAENENGFFSPDVPLITEAVHSNNNGGFELIIKPNPPLEGGEYLAKISVGENQSVKNFIFVSMDSVEGLYELAKKCKSKEELESLVSDNTYDMGISTAYWEQYHTVLTDNIYSGLSICENAEDFLKLCRSSLATERIINGENISDVLLECRNSLYVEDVTCYDMWQFIDEDSKNDVMNNYSKGKDPAFSLAEAMALSAVKNAENWRDLADILSPMDKNVFTKVFNLNTTNCANYNSDSIIRYAYNDIDRMNSIDAIREIFYEASKNYNKDKNSSTGSTSGSSGSFSPITHDSPTTTPEITFEQNNNENSIFAFSDTIGHWGEAYINSLYKSGYIKGYEDGSFRPDELVTRAEFAVMISACFEIESQNQIDGFADVSAEEWYAKEVIACKSSGIIFGDENNRFTPEQNITREDAAVMLFRIISTKVASNGDYQIPFNDAADISDYASNAVGMMVDEGIISGFGNGYFMPKQNTTRAQAAAMLIKSLDLLSVS